MKAFTCTGINPCRLLAVLSILVALTSTSEAQVATYFGYSPDTPLHLGAGVVPQELSRTFAPCLTATEKEIDGPGALHTTFSMSVVTNSHAMQESVGIDVKVKAAGPFAKGEATFHEETDTTFDEDSAAVVIRGEAEYSRHILTDMTLSKNAAQSLKKGTATYWRQCGTYLVAAERRGVMVSIVLNMHNLSKDLRRKIAASADVSGGVGVVTGSISASVTDALHTDDVSTETSITVIASGGPGLPGLSDVVTALAHPKDKKLDDILTALKTFISGLSKDNAAPIGFFISPPPTPAPAPPDDPVYPERMRDIVEISDRFETTARLLESAKAILAGNDGRSNLLTEKTLGDVEDQKNKLTGDLATLGSQYLKCAQPGPDLSACKLDPPAEVLAILADSPNVAVKARLRTPNELLSPAITLAVLTDPAGGDLTARLKNYHLPVADPEFFIQIKGAIIADLSVVKSGDTHPLKTAYPASLTKRTRSPFSNVLLVNMNLLPTAALASGRAELIKENGKVHLKLKSTATPDPPPPSADVELPLGDVIFDYACSSTTPDADYQFDLIIRRLADSIGLKPVMLATITKKSKANGVEVVFRTKEEVNLATDGWTFFIPKAYCQ